MTDKHAAVLEAMQDAKAELGVPYSDFGRWAVGDARFRERVKLGKRLRHGEARQSFELAARLFEASAARLQAQLDREQRAAA